MARRRTGPRLTHKHWQDLSMTSPQRVLCGLARVLMVMISLLLYIAPYNSCICIFQSPFKRSSCPHLTLLCLPQNDTVLSLKLREGEDTLICKGVTFFHYRNIHKAATNHRWSLYRSRVTIWQQIISS